MGCKELTSDGYLPWGWLLLDWDDAHGPARGVNPWEVTESLLPVRVRDVRQQAKLKKLDVFKPDDLVSMELLTGQEPVVNDSIMPPKEAPLHWCHDVL